MTKQFSFDSILGDDKFRNQEEKRSLKRTMSNSLKIRIFKNIDFVFFDFPLKSHFASKRQTMQNVCMLTFLQSNPGKLSKCQKVKVRLFVCYSLIPS